MRENVKSSFCEPKHGGLKYPHGGIWEIGAAEQRDKHGKEYHEIKWHKGKDSKFIHKDYQLDLVLDSAILGFSQLGLSIRDIMCVPLLDFLFKNKLGKAIFDEEAMPMELGEAVSDLGALQHKMHWGGIKKVAKGAAKAAKSVAKGAAKAAKSVAKGAKSVAKFAQKVGKGVKALALIYAAIQSGRKVKPALTSVQWVAHLMKFLLTKHYEELVAEKCGPEPGKKCATENKNHALYGKVESNMQTFRSMALGCGPYFGALLAKGQWMNLIPKTRWNWDPKKYAIQCSVGNRDTCKNAADHYPEFPLYLSPYTKSNKKSGYPAAPLHWVYQMRAGFGCVGITGTEKMAAYRKLVTDPERLGFGELAKPKGKQTFGFTKDCRTNDGYPAGFERILIEGTKSDSYRYKESMKDRLEAGWDLDGIELGSRDYSLIIERRITPSNAIQCAAVVSAQVRMCSTCCCKDPNTGAHSLLNAGFSNSLIYVNPLKIKDIKMKSKNGKYSVSSDDENPNLAECKMWFTQAVAAFQLMVGGVRAAAFTKHTSELGGC